MVDVACKPKLNEPTLENVTGKVITKDLPDAIAGIFHVNSPVLVSPILLVVGVPNWYVPNCGLVKVTRTSPVGFAPALVTVATMFTVSL